MLDFNTIVIGSGPAGMMAALYLKRAGIEVLLIDKDAPGGTILKTTKIENYLGFESINGAELALKMYNHIKENEIPFEFSEVISIEKNNYYLIKTKNKEFTSKHVIIATGRTPNKLKINGEDKINGISYCAVCDGSFYKNETVAVVGGGNSAFTNALYLSDICKQVYIFIRCDARADEELINRAKNKENIVVLKNSEISEFLSKENKLTGVILKDLKKVDLTGLFVAIGSKPKTDFIKDIELEKDYIKVNNHMETSLKGLYAIGDVIKKDYYQIATAISDGAVAALSIKEGS